MAAYCSCAIVVVVDWTVIHVWLSLTALNAADNCLMRVVDRNIPNRDFNSRFEIAERAGEVLFCFVAYHLPNQLALAGDAKDNRPAIPIQERAKRPAGFAALACGFLELHSLAFTFGDK